MRSMTVFISMCARLELKELHLLGTSESFVDQIYAAPQLLHSVDNTGKGVIAINDLLETHEEPL